MLFRPEQIATTLLANYEASQEAFPCLLGRSEPSNRPTPEQVMHLGAIEPTLGQSVARLRQRFEFDTSSRFRIDIVLVRTFGDLDTEVHSRPNLAPQTVFHLV